MEEKKLKEIPIFKTEDEEREFWATHCSCDYVDWDKAEEAVFPNLKPTDPELLKELEEGYKANHDYYKQEQEDWKFADSPEDEEEQ